PSAVGLAVGASGRRCVVSRSFFFSSRRRHTRSLRDWSSDVCSSDLIEFTSTSGRIRILLVEFNLLRNTPLRYPVPLPRIQNGGEIGRASCRERGVRVGGRWAGKKKRRAKNTRRQVGADVNRGS